MNILVVMYVLSRMSVAYGLAMTVPFVISLFTGEGGAPALACGAVISICIGSVMGHVSKNSVDTLTVQEGIAITALSWIMATFLGMIPYVIGGYLGILDGVVECISGLSGTGATVIPDVTVLPESILLWRSMTHWLGGLGIIVIFIALFPQFGKGIMHMLDAESTGPTSDRMVPRIKTMAKALFTVYLVLTALASAAYMWCGMDALTAVDHAMSTIATGGFSTYNESVAHFHNPVLEGWVIFFMILSSANFSLYVVAWKRGITAVFRDREFQVFCLIVLVSALLMTANLVGMGLERGEAFRQALFQAASISSSTGFVSADFDQWPSFCKAILLFLMFCGGCAGSTAGGLKTTRLILLFKSLHLVVKQKILPHGVMAVRSNGEVYGEDIITGVMRFFAFYLFLDLTWSALFIWDGVPLLDALGLSISTMGSCGPAFGIVGATCTYADLPVFSKCVVAISMLMGRLEIYPVLALLMPSFWRRFNW